MEQLDSQVPAADVALDDATLDRIDEIVRPGVNLSPADTSYHEDVFEPALRRRQRGRALAGERRDGSSATPPVAVGRIGCRMSRRALARLVPWWGR